MPSTDHFRISPTAKLVAYWRQFADLPFSKEIANYFNVEDVIRDSFGQEHLNFEKNIFVPLVELRYKTLQHIIRKKGFKQVLEFASGISLRGLAMTADPEMVYVESDLPEITAEKMPVVEKIISSHSIANRKNLFFDSANILNYAEIEPLLEHFDRSKPLIIVNEGLFQYLSKPEKKIAATHIHKVLSQFPGGMWVTPDLDTKEAVDDKNERFKSIRNAIHQETGRNFVDNAFDSEEEAVCFFEELGFAVSFQPQIGDDEIFESIGSKDLLSVEGLEIMKKLRLTLLSIA